MARTRRKKQSGTSLVWTPDENAILRYVHEVQITPWSILQEAALPNRTLRGLRYRLRVLQNERAACHRIIDECRKKREVYATTAPDTQELASNVFQDLARLLTGL
jgi:hypothetical protein